MNQKELNDVFDSVFKEVEELMKAKGEEYSNKKDRLVNFRRGTTPVMKTMESVLMSYCGKHWTSLELHVSGDSELKKEQIREKAKDVIIYMILLIAMGEDRTITFTFGTPELQKAWEKHELERAKKADDLSKTLRAMIGHDRTREKVTLKDLSPHINEVQKEFEEVRSQATLAHITEEDTDAIIESIERIPVEEEPHV